jgi:hypothetical protein
LYEGVVLTRPVVVLSICVLGVGCSSSPPHRSAAVAATTATTIATPQACAVTRFGVVGAPDGRAQPLVFGPEAHATSSYDRPGDEWGTGLRFGTRGCWHIHLARADTSADVWLDVH